MKKDLSVFIKYSQLTALLLNFIGAIFLIFASDISPGGWTNLDDNGMPLDALYLIYPTIFKIGISLIIAGFVIQLLNELLKFDKIKEKLAKASLKKIIQNIENSPK